MKDFKELINIEEKSKTIIDEQLLYVAVEFDGRSYEGWISPEKGDIKCFMFEEKELRNLVKTNDGKTVMVKVKELIGMKSWPW